MFLPNSGSALPAKSIPLSQASNVCHEDPATDPKMTASNRVAAINMTLTTFRNAETSISSMKDCSGPLGASLRASQIFVPRTLMDINSPSKNRITFAEIDFQKTLSYPTESNHNKST